MSRKPALFIAAIVALALILALTPGCRKRGGTWLLGMDDEIRIGQDAADEFEKDNPVSRDPALTALVSGIGARIATAAKPPDYPYDFRVIDSATINALAFPGGRIYMYRGLIERLDHDPHKIAWVLGHEAAHVARRHSAKRIEAQLGVALLTDLLLGRKRVAEIAHVVSGLMILDYGRDKEFEADELGLIYAHRAGYDPTAAIGAMRIFQELHGERDPGRLELLFMTHPGDNARLDNIKRVCEREGFTGRYIR